MTTTNTDLIPANTRLAAKRAAIRTTAQSYATALAGGISGSVILSVVTGDQALVPTLITWGVALVSPLFAGAAAYLDVTARGIPEDYQTADAPAEEQS